MKLTKKTTIQTSIVILLLMAFALPLTAYAKPAKVDVCHWDGDEGTFKLINISEKALKAHLKQGGVLPGTNGLDENCDPLPDNDGDGIPDVDDIDDDNDGQTDVDELACGSDPLDSGSMAADFDGDSSPDCVDPDDDNDGVDDVNDPYPFDPTRIDNCPLDPYTEAAPGVDWSGCDLVRFRPGDGINLSGANFSGANLFDSVIQEADLTNVDFSNANLSRSNLNRADLSGANLSGANLEFAEIAEANLTGANLTGANVSGTSFTYSTWANTICPDGSNSDSNGGACYL